MEQEEEEEEKKADSLTNILSRASAAVVKEVIGGMEDME